MKIPKGWSKTDFLSPSNIKGSAEIIKARVTVPDVVAMYAPTPAPRAGRIPCPIHGGKGYNLSIRRYRYYCFVCGSSGDCIDFVKALFGLKYAEAISKINADFNIGLDTKEAAGMSDAAKAAIAQREERERQHREALESFRRWDDLLHTYDTWLEAYPPGDKRHDDAEHELAKVLYLRNSAEEQLKQFE